MTIPVSNTANSQSFGAWFERTNQMAAIMTSNAVTADASSNGSLTTGNSSVNGIFSSTTMVVTTGLRGGNVSTSNTLTITSNTTFSANALFNANAYANASINVINNNNVNVTGTTNTVNLVVTGNTTLSTITVNGFFTVANSANIAGNLSVLGNMFVTGNTTTTGTVLANGDYLAVQNDTYKIGNSTYGFITFSSNASISKTLSISNTSFSTANTYAFTNTTLQTVDSFSTSLYRSVEYLVQMSDSTNTRYQVSKILGVQDGTGAYVTEYGIINNGTSMGVFSATLSGGNFNLQCVPTSNTTVAKIFRTVLAV